MSLSRLKQPAGLVLLLLVALSALAGCGFRPLYAPPGEDAAPEARAVASQLAEIRVAPIINRQGQELRNRLSDMLHAGATDVGTRYQLNVGLGELQQSLAIRQTGLATRANLYMNATFNLVDAVTGQPLLTGSTVGIASYDLLDEDFATLTAINDARSRVLARIADNIRDRLAVHFVSAARTAATPPAAGGPEPPAPPSDQTAIGLPERAPWPGAPSAVPPLVLVPSPATEPTIASPAGTPIDLTPPTPGDASATEGQP